MERKRIKEVISNVDFNGIPLVKVGEDEFITLEPVAKGVRNLQQAEDIAKRFADKNGCYANIAFDTQWHKLIKIIEKNCVTEIFSIENNLVKNEVILIDSKSGGREFVLTAGQFHKLDETFKGFISGDDSDGEPQSEKLVFLTVRIK